MKILKQHSLASLYLILFIVVQTIYSAVFLLHRITYDVDFTDKIAEVFSEYYTEDYELILSKYPDMVISMLDIMSEITVPMLFFSNLTVILVLVGIAKIRGKINKDILKVSTDDILYYSFIGICLNLVISLIIYYLPESLISGHSDYTSMTLHGNPLLVILSAGVLAPVAEELVFRYGILNNLKVINMRYAIIIQALSFGLLHGNIVQITYAFILGLYLGYLAVKNNSVKYSIIVHVAINTSSVLVMLSGLNEFLVLSMLAVIVLSVYIAKQDFIQKSNQAET